MKLAKYRALKSLELLQVNGPVDSKELFRPGNALQARKLVRVALCELLDHAAKDVIRWRIPRQHLLSRPPRDARAAAGICAWKAAFSK